MTNKNHLTGTDRVVEAYDIIKDEEFDANRKCSR